MRGPPVCLGDPGRVISVVFGCRPEQVAERVVVTPFLPLRAFRREVEGEPVDLSPPFFYKGFTASFGGRPVTVLHAGVGPSRVGDCLGFLSLTPARRILFAGAVGGLAEAHAIGDGFLPVAAADGEGYARYARESFGEVARSAPCLPCASPLGERLGAFLAGRGWTVHRGRVFTVGAITFETEANLRLLARLGYDALEMELSAFYAAAGRYGLEAAALTYVSDLPLRSDLWAPKSASEQEALRRAYRAVPRLALEFLAAA